MKKKGNLDFGLESIQPIQERTVRNLELDFNDVPKLLKEVSILDIVLKKSEMTSAKFDKDREEKIQDGFATIQRLTEISDEFKINPLLLLLGKFWEHKEHRSHIKKMIEEEADKKGYHSADYVQNVLGKQVEQLHEIACAIDRLLFVKTYYKPRPQKGDKKRKELPPKTQRMNINGQVYDVPILKLNETREKFVGNDDKEAFKKEVVSFSTPVSEDEILSV